MSFNKVLFFLLSFFLLFALGSKKSAAQTTTTGDLTGVITDPTGAIVPNIAVQLTNTRQGTKLDTKTNESGQYHFSLLPTGSYEINVNASGFLPVGRTINVNIGQVATMDIKLSLGTSNEKIVITEPEPLVQTESSSTSATLSEAQIQSMPNQGNDMTYPLETTPGVTENTLGGYGNYSVNGLPATSNLFTVDGMDNNDPYLSIGNTGATSLMLGESEVQETTIVSNGYGGQFGSLAGSNVNIVTRGGSNQFHGSATYYWNGRAFNANSFFNNEHGAPRSFVNANQYSANVGGPILKDKLFWYFNTEGLRLIIPSSPTTQLVPSPEFEAATLANLQAIHPASVPFYNTIFGIYDAARTSHGAVPGSNSSIDPTGCGTFTGLGAGVNCAYNFISNGTIPTRESLYSARIDYNAGNNDRIFGRFQLDRGFQGSATDPIDPVFNLVSNQPEYQGQLSENHTFGPTVTNQLIVAGQWYEATFNAPNRTAALAAFPTSLAFINGFANFAIFDSLGPQGRAITQAQLSDDVTKIAGKHTLKFGLKYRRNDVSDFVYGINTSGTAVIPDLNAFYNGGYDPLNPTGDATSFSQAFPTSTEQRFKFWSIGAYAEDDIQVKPNFNLTLSLRADHPSNPTCKTLCFSRLAEPFNVLASDPALAGPDAPYNQIFDVNNRTALVGLTNIEWAPRIGFAWQPLGRDHSTVIRGGVGIFYDAFAGQVVDNISENPPLYQNFTVGGSSGATPLLISPAEANSLPGAAAASNRAFLSGFASGASETTLAATVPGFVPPSVNYVNNFTSVPYYEKWSLGIEQAFGKNTSVDINYSGNHGIHEVVQNSTLNAYSPTPFVGLPSAPPDAAFGYVNGIFSDGTSNYNGLSISATHRYATGQITANYTYSHALDDISNGGFSPLAFQAFFSTNTSPIFAEQPYSLAGLYSSSDYDARHYFSLSYLWELPFKRLAFGHGPDALLKGWTVAGTVLTRTGLPFSVVDLSTTAKLETTNYGQLASPSTPAPVVFANSTGISPGNCSGPGPDVTAPCFNTAAFAASPNGFGNTTRNAMRGPGYFNSDFSVWKKVGQVPHWEKAEFNLGFQFYNIFNHPNFDNPVYDVSNTTSFGTLQRTISPATTVYGVALGADASPRIVQLKAQIKF